MPRGRPRNYDARIGNLLDQLRYAIIAREQAAMDARVSAQVRALVSSIGTVQLGGPDTKTAKTDGATAPSKRRKRKPMSAAQKKAVGARMKRYWAERRKQKEGK